MIQPWTEVLSNPESLLLYDNAPCLDGVDLLEFGFAHGLSVLNVALSIDDLPVKRSTRWPKAMNAVALRLQFTDVLTCSLSQTRSIGDGVRVDCSFKKAGGGFLFECSGAQLSFWAECNYARVAGLEGYIREASGAEAVIA